MCVVSRNLFVATLTNVQLDTKQNVRYQIGKKEKLRRPGRVHGAISLYQEKSLHLKTSFFPKYKRFTKIQIAIAYWAA